MTQAHPPFARAAWAARGWTMTEDPAPTVTVDGRDAVTFRLGNRLLLDITASVQAIRLRSRVAAPADLDPDSHDTRRVGIAVVAVHLDGPRAELGDPRLSGGWHPVEPGLRWTDGDAEIRVDGIARIEIDVAPGLPRHATGPAEALAVARQRTRPTSR